MAKTLADIFKQLDAAGLQHAADDIFADVADAPSRLMLLTQVISGEVNPSFTRSQAILDWDKKQKKAAAPKSTLPVSRTVTTPSKAPRRPVTGMTW